MSERIVDDEESIILSLAEENTRLLTGADATIMDVDDVDAALEPVALPPPPAVVGTEAAAELTATGTITWLPKPKNYQQ